MSNAILRFLFVDVARLDFECHVPRITDLWETILLGAALQRRRVPSPC
jgi:hypothetical protein